MPRGPERGLRHYGRAFVVLRRVRAEGADPSSFTSEENRLQMRGHTREPFRPDASARIGPDPDVVLRGRRLASVCRQRRR
jgi:hypothetical protein